MEIFDSHAHIYPEKIAEKATKAIGDFYNLKMEEDKGTPSRLIEVGKYAGISKYLVHSCATKSSQVHAINEFILQEITVHKEFIGFMTLHQDLTIEEMKEEILFCKANGFKGIKLHPDFQKFDIDCEDAEKIYKAVVETNCNFPILLHMGDNRFDFSKPEKLCAMAKKYPSITFIGAHFGGYRCWDNLEQYKGINNIYFDTSSSLDFIGSKRAKELIEFFGVDKFFFGTDFPMWSPKDELKRFFDIGLTNEENEKILSKNLKKLLNI